MVVSVPCDIGKDYDTSFEMNKFNFGKFCGRKGATQLLLVSYHFVSPTISFLLLGVNLMPTTLVFTCHHIFTYQHLTMSVRAHYIDVISYGVNSRF